MEESRKDRILRWNVNYTHLTFFREWTPEKQYTGWIKLRIFEDTIFPRMVNRVSYHDERGITIFEIQNGEFFAGNDMTLNLKMYEYPNGVILAEVHAIKEGDSNGR